MLKQIPNWTEKFDPATRKVTPRPFLIVAWEPIKKPIHLWKGHRKTGKNGVVKIFPHPRGLGVPHGDEKNFQSCNIPF